MKSALTQQRKAYSDRLKLSYCSTVLRSLYL